MQPEEMKMEINIDELEAAVWENVQVKRRVPLLVENIHDWNTCIADKNYLYCFNNRYYEKIEEIEFCRIFENAYRINWNDYAPNKGKQAYEHLMQKNILTIFNQPSHLIPFKNGVFNDISKEMEEFNSDYHFISVIPYEYTDDNPDLFLKTMSEILPVKVDKCKIMKFIRYCLTNSVDYQFGQIWQGGGNNGKTKLAELVAELLGDFSTPFDVSRLSTDKGYIVSLRNKQLAICSEIGGSYLNNAAMEQWKKLITDKLISARGAYEKPTSWINGTKFIVCTNNLPTLRNNKDRAFFRRWQVVDFPTDFTGIEDRTLFDRILKNEGGSILSYLLREINYDDIIPDPWEEVQEFWLNTSSTVRKYVSEACELDGIGNPETGDLYGDYVEWCNSMDIEPSSKRVMANDLRRMGIRSKKGYDNIYRYIGISIGDV